MTELSDFRRIVHEPLEKRARQLRRQLDEAVAETLRFRGETVRLLDLLHEVQQSTDYEQEWPSDLQNRVDEELRPF